MVNRRARRVRKYISMVVLLRILGLGGGYVAIEL